MTSVKQYAFILIALCWASLLYAAPKKELMNQWIVFNPKATQTINHQAWNQFLKKYVSTNPQGITVVNYQGVSQKDKQALKNYIQSLEQVQIDQYNRPEQMAYWINLYNAETVDLILQHYPVKSIVNIDLSQGFFSHGPWGANVVKVEGRKLSLNDIEHRILRPIWNDPRIHFAVNCASIGCPNLQQQAFTAKTLEAQLNQGAANYINNPRGMSIKDGKLYASKIFDWYGKDFGGTQQDIINFAKIYAKPKLKAQLATVNHISGTSYDWNLNEK